MDVEALARAMVERCAAEEQCVRRVPDDAVAEAVRARVRELAREAGLRVRTARMADAVVVVRTDAAVWTEDAATMRRTLTPSDG